MKYAAAIDVTDNNRILYYEIRNEAGMFIGSAIANESPFEGSRPVTMEDAEKNAKLWAAAPDLLEALHQIAARSRVGIIKKIAQEAIKKARGL